MTYHDYLMLGRSRLCPSCGNYYLASCIFKRVKTLVDPNCFLLFFERDEKGVVMYSSTSRLLVVVGGTRAVVTTSLRVV
jgi:hypothetical protein